MAALPKVHHYAVTRQGESTILLYCQSCERRLYLFHFPSPQIRVRIETVGWIAQKAIEGVLYHENLRNSHPLEVYHNHRKGSIRFYCDFCDVVILRGSFQEGERNPTAGMIMSVARDAIVRGLDHAKLAGGCEIELGSML